MVWFRVDDGFHDHPKVEALLESKHASDAIALWTLAGSWCSKQLTDGEISTSKVARLGIRNHAKAAQELVRVRLWERTESGFRFHQWTECQRTREDVVQTRREASDRMRRNRANQKARQEETGRESIDESGNVRANKTKDVRANDARSSSVQVSERSSTHSIPFHSVPYQNPNQDTAPARETLASVSREVGEALATPSRLTCTSDLRPVPATTTPPTMVDESLRFPDPDAENFNERDLERAVSKVRGTEWRIPTALHHRRQARETAALIMEFAHQGGYDPHAIARAAYDEWRKASKSIDPMVWCADWAAKLPPPPKPQEKWRDLEG